MKQLFDNAVGSVPPSTVDVKAIVRKRRRVTAWQRSVFAGVVAFAATVGIGMSVVEDGSRVPPTTPSPSPMVSIEPPPERINRAWSFSARRVLSGAIWKLQDEDDNAMIPVDGPYELRRGADRSVGIGSITIGGVESGINFTSEKPETKPCRFVNGSLACIEYFPRCDESEYKPSCAYSSGPNGEIIRIKREDHKLYSYRYVAIHIDVFSADNTRHVGIRIDNRPGSDGAPLPVTTKLAVTAEQALDIILGEPALWY